MANGHGFTRASDGANRWTYTDSLGLNDQTWAGMTHDQKVTAVKQMYKHEGGNGQAIGGTVAQTTS